MRKPAIALTLMALLITAKAAVFLNPSVQADSSADDWPMFRHDPARTAYSSISGPSTPKVLWTFSTNDNSMESSPAVVDGKLYVGSTNGNIYCLNATNGHQIWLNFKIDSEIQSSPAVVNGFLYVCDRNGVVYCLDTQTGIIMWKFQTGVGMSSSPAVVNSYVYISSADGNLYCLNAFDGKEVWHFSITSLAGPSSPYDEPSITSGSTSPAVVDGYVYVGGTHLYCLNANSGTLGWSFSANVACAPTVYEGKVYFSSRDKNAYCLDASTGNKIWEKPVITSELYTTTSPAVANGLVYFGSWVQCLNASNGARIWRYGTGDIYAASGPTVAGQYAYFCGNDGNTYCVKASSGEYVWKSEGSFGGSPVAVNGVLYIAGGSIIAFSDSGALRTPTPPPTPSTTPSLYPSTSQSKDMAFLAPVLVVIALAVAAMSTAIFLDYRTKRKGNVQAKLKKRFTLPIALALILVIAVSLVVTLYANNLISPNGTPSQHSPATLLWQTSIEHFATSMAIADGKMFITTMQGIYAYDAQSGQLIWNNDNAARGVQVYNGSVYVGIFGSVVYRLDENTGEKILSYQAPAHSNLAWKGTPGFAVADGKVFASSDGIAVYDVNSGGLYWKIENTFYYPWTPPPQPTLGELSSSAKPSNYVYILQGARVDANNGKRLWDTGNYLAANYVITENKVVFWNFWTDSAHPNTILCVDASSGRTLWRFNAGIPVYQPAAYNGLLLFAATDGSLYALKLVDGSLAWKTPVDTKGMMKGNNLPAEAKSFSEPSVSPVVVDIKTNMATWGFLVTQHQINGINGNNLYVGVVCSLDLSNGTISRTSNIQANGTINDGAGLGLAPGDKVLYLTAGLDLWTIEKASGDATLIQHYEHFTAPIILSNKTVYIATDLYLSAYK